MNSIWPHRATSPTLETTARRRDPRRPPSRDPDRDRNLVVLRPQHPRTAPRPAEPAQPRQDHPAPREPARRTPPRPSSEPVRVQRQPSNTGVLPRALRRRGNAVPARRSLEGACPWSSSSQICRPCAERGPFRLRRDTSLRTRLGEACQSARPTADQATARTAIGAGPRISWQRACRSARPSSSRVATWSPAGPTPNVKGSQ